MYRFLSLKPLAASQSAAAVAQANLDYHYNSDSVDLAMLTEFASFLDTHHPAIWLVPKQVEMSLQTKGIDLCTRALMQPGKSLAQIKAVQHKRRLYQNLTLQLVAALDLLVDKGVLEKAPLTGQH